MEGDTVLIELDSVTLWKEMKIPNIKHPESEAGGNKAGYRDLTQGYSNTEAIE